MSNDGAGGAGKGPSSSSSANVADGAAAAADGKLIFDDVAVGEVRKPRIARRPYTLRVRRWKPTCPFTSNTEIGALTAVQARASATNIGKMLMDIPASLVRPSHWTIAS